MCSEKVAVHAERLCKVFDIYDRPLDRLKQFLANGRKQYGKRFHALTDVSFELERGKVLGLVGRNGAGKSTLLQIVCNTLKPSSGNLAVNGRVAALLELGAGFNPDFSGRENIYLNASVLGLSLEEITERYAAIVEFSGIEDFIEQPVKTYSSGMYVRLAFSIATSVSPDILVIDEALSVGDGAFARKSFDRIMDLRSNGATILFCSHSMYHIEAICDQALWLEHGRVEILGNPHEVTRAYEAKTVAAIQHPLPPETSPITSSTGESLTYIEGQARILSIEASADEAPGKQLVLRSGASTLRIDVIFEYDPALPVPSIVFALETTFGTLISSGCTAIDGPAPELLEPGRAQTKLVFESIPLMRGQYLLSIFVVCERVLHMYDHAPHCVELEVTQDGLERGLVFLPHYWGSPS